MLLATALLALGALVGFSRADCEACIDHQCHYRQTIISGFQITDQMAIDRTDNVLYLQLNGNQNVAIFLDDDDRQIRLINMMRTSGMFMDQKSEKLYLGAKDIPRTYYTYDRASNATRTINILYPPHPDVQDYSGNNLPLLTKTWHYKYLKNFTISSLVIIVDNMVFFDSNNTLYLHFNVDLPPIEFLRRDHIVLSSDKSDQVYIGDATEKVIYKLDTITRELNVYAAYKTGAMEEFIFDSKNYILSRDVDSSVVRWMPSLPYRVVDCSVEPPSTSFFIRQLEAVKP